tara:strand:- start:21 stop:188 length:168 start_codon:yes stop_codon:yes gene_type:complete
VNEREYVSNSTPIKDYSSEHHPDMDKDEDIPDLYSKEEWDKMVEHGDTNPNVEGG